MEWKCKHCKLITSTGCPTYSRGGSPEPEDFACLPGKQAMQLREVLYKIQERSHNVYPEIHRMAEKGLEN